jgi:hypothetical protein
MLLTSFSFPKQVTRGNDPVDLKAAGFGRLADALGERLAFKGWNNDAKAYFLISLLSNLEELSVYPEKHSALSKYHGHLTLLMEERLLSPRLHSWERGNSRLKDDWFNIAGLIPVLLYPSMKTVKAHSVSSDRLFYRLDKRWAQITTIYGLSNVETIELLGSEIKINDLTDILRLCHSLKRFIFRGGKLEASTANVSPRREIPGAFEHVAPTLEFLHLDWALETLYLDWPVCPLTNLGAVKELEINWNILGFPFRTSPNVASMSPSTLFPPSLESLVIIPPNFAIWGELESFISLKDLLSEISPTCLPHLRKVICIDYGNGSAFPDWLISLARERDVSLILESRTLDLAQL